MGFTRYFDINKKLNPSLFKKYSKDCKILCDYITKRWGHGISNWDGSDEPKFTDTFISFNGSNGKTGEVFKIESSSFGFNFTKTRLLPYDRHVFACLLLAQKYFGDSIILNSDTLSEVGIVDDEIGGYGEIINLVELILREKKIDSILKK